MYTFQIFFVCVHSRGQRSSSPDELNDTLHDKIALPDKLHAEMRMQFLIKLHGFLPKLHAHAIYWVMQSYRAGCC